MKAATLSPLLSVGDPSPVELVNPSSNAPIVLVCEHAGRAVPASLHTLGVTPDVLNSHRGWDIGAEDVARELADRLDAPLVLQRYSRLVIDANRPPRSSSAIPVQSDGVGIPGNQSLSEVERDSRIASVFDPFDAAVTGAFATHKRTAAFSIHSYTKRFGGVDRPWHAGFLSRADQATANALIARIADTHPDLTLALNQPYSIEDATDWFIPVHTEARALRHCLIEIRNDQIDQADGVSLWAGLLADAITDVLRART